MTLRGKAKNAPVDIVISDKPTDLTKPPSELKEDKRRARRTSAAAAAAKTGTAGGSAKIVVKASCILNGGGYNSGNGTSVSSTCENLENQKPNIILHLKCHLKDLTEHDSKIHSEYKYNPDVPPEIVAYDKHEIPYTFLSGDAISKDGVPTPIIATESGCVDVATIVDDGIPPRCSSVNDDHFLRSVSENSIFTGGSGGAQSQNSAAAAAAPTETQINAKLKRLKLAFFKNALDKKNSACFWCSYDFENPACYIPKYEFDRTIHAYGSFCTPECAAGFLFREDIDDSVKFERFHLLNKIYGEVFDYEKNIKPAPNPHYLLSKYYGNLNIEEYRALSRSDKTLLVVEQPMTRILPELHEEKDKMVCSGVYRVKRQSDVAANKQSKNDILKEAFGLA